MGGGAGNRQARNWDWRARRQQHPTQSIGRGEGPAIPAGSVGRITKSDYARRSRSGSEPYHRLVETLIVTCTQFDEVERLRTELDVIASCESSWVELANEMKRDGRS